MLLVCCYKERQIHPIYPVLLVRDTFRRPRKKFEQFLNQARMIYFGIPRTLTWTISHTRCTSDSTWWLKQRSTPIQGWFRLKRWLHRLGWNYGGHEMTIHLLDLDRWWYELELSQWHQCQNRWLPGGILPILQNHCNLNNMKVLDTQHSLAYG